MLRYSLGLLALVVLGLVGCGSRNAATPPRRTTTAAIPSVHPADWIARARDYRPLFSIFPPAVEKEACSIPRGGPTSGAHLQGTCRTQLFVLHGPRSEVAVVFTERWPVRNFGPKSRCCSDWAHAWQVIIELTGHPRVAHVHSSGQPPPQFVR